MQAVAVAVAAALVRPCALALQVQEHALSGLDHGPWRCWSKQDKWSSAV